MWLNRHFIMEPKSGPAPPRVVKVQIIGWIMSLTRKLQVLVVIVEHCWLFQQLYWIMLGCALLGGSRLTWSSTDLSKAGIERKQFSNQSEEQLVHSAHSRSVYVILCHYSRLCDLVLVTLKYDARAGNGPDLWVLRGEGPGVQCVVQGTISDHLKALSRVLSRVQSIDHHDVCLPCPLPSQYSSISFLTSQPGPASLGYGNEIWYQLNIKTIFCCLSAPLGQSAPRRLLQEWWELLLSSI